jgi:hypothetical protein
MLKLAGIKPRISFNLVPILPRYLFKAILTILYKLLKLFNQYILQLALFLPLYIHSKINFYAKKICPIFYLYADIVHRSGDRSNHTI